MRHRLRKIAMTGSLNGVRHTFSVLPSLSSCPKAHLNDARRVHKVDARHVTRDVFERNEPPEHAAGDEELGGTRADLVRRRSYVALGEVMGTEAERAWNKHERWMKRRRITLI